MRSEERITAELTKLIGPAGLVRLAEARGGTRLYVPVNLDQSTLIDDLGREIAEKLVKRYGREYIDVPLAREPRARHHRAAGRSNAEIALKLGITERGVERMFASMKNPPAKGSGDPRQLKLFG